VKKFILFLILIFIPEVKAEETWVKVGQSMFSPIPGSLAYEMCTKDNFCGMGYFIDVRSLVERGNFRYFNLDVSGLDKNGFKSSNKKHSGKGWTVDCENNLLGTQINLKEPSGSPEFDVINFVCSSNKTDSSNKVGSQWRKYGDFNAYWGGIKLDSSYLSTNGYVHYEIKIESNDTFEPVNEIFDVDCSRRKFFSPDKKWFTPKNEYKSMILNDLCSDKKGDPEIINIIKANGWKQYTKNLWVNVKGWYETSTSNQYATQIYNAINQGYDTVNVLCDQNKIAFYVYDQWGDWNYASGIKKEILNDGCNF
tara:strand:- start:216 stop:1142 length:927 start_codon:yes stop_codon:yes gene_type:complete